MKNRLPGSVSSQAKDWLMPKFGAIYIMASGDPYRSASTFAAQHPSGAPVDVPMIKTRSPRR